MKMRAILASAILVLVLLAAACEKATIAKLLDNPSKYAGKEVGIIGTVRDAYGVDIPFTSVRGGVYKIDDGTGTIWVLTQQSVPQRGSRVGVKGRFQNAGINFNGKTFGGLGIVESDRRIR